METYKQLMDSLGAELANECKQKKDKNIHLAAAERLLESGADVNYNGCRPIYFAVKNYNFPLISLLITYGALDNVLSRKYLAALCQKGRFDQKKEEAFFGLIDTAIKKTGFDMLYLEPYINFALLQGDVERLHTAAEKYEFSLEQAVKRVKQRVIFELIELNREDSLTLIKRYTNWEEDAIDAAASVGNDKIIEYILERNKSVAPSKGSIVRAICQGYVQVLEVLDFYGISLDEQAYVRAAALSLPASYKPLLFLANKGIAAMGYDGKTLQENARDDNNKYLLEFVKNLKICLL